MGTLLQNVTLIRNSKTPWEVCALKNIELAIEDGESIALMGPSGAGKSSLMQLIMELIPPTTGRIARPAETKVGLVFQEPHRGFFAVSVWEEVAFGPRNLGLSPQIVETRVLEALKAVELPEEYWERSPFHLSGGQQRRVAIAAVLALKPQILLLDEPSIGLDWLGETALVHLLKRLHREEGVTLVVGSHDPNLLYRLCTRVLVMDKGRIIADALWSDWPSLEHVFRDLGLRGPTALETWSELFKRGATRECAPTDEASALRVFRHVGEGLTESGVY